MAVPKCEECRFWVEERGLDETEGECFRYPPTVVALAAEDGLITPVSARPRTNRNHSCGEFKHWESD